MTTVGTILTQVSLSTFDAVDWRRDMCQPFLRKTFSCKIRKGFKARSARHKPQIILSSSNLMFRPHFQDPGFSLQAMNTIVVFNALYVFSSFLSSQTLILYSVFWCSHCHLNLLNPWNVNDSSNCMTELQMEAYKLIKCFRQLGIRGDC